MLMLSKIDTFVATGDRRLVLAIVILGLFAAFWALHEGMRLCFGLYRMFLRPGKNLKKIYGKWACVTGATDGIGRAMALELARKGLNVVLISRTLSKLEETADEIKKKYSTIEVKVLDIDFNNFDAAARKRVADCFAEIDVGVLINNVGISYPYPKYFYELDDERVEQLMKLNVDSTTWMTKIALPGMLTRKTGAIVNVGSAAGVSSCPLLAEYGAAKSYVTAFAKSLDVELRPKGVHVQCQVALFVATKLAKIKKASLFVPSPSQYARSAVAAIGYESVVSPYWSHRMQFFLMDLLPVWIVDRIVLSMHMGIRSAGMKKDAREAKAN